MANDGGFTEERRWELAGKVAVLDERSQTQGKQLDRIETKVDTHANEVEDSMTTVQTTLIKLPGALESKIENKVSEMVNPLTEKVLILEKRIDKIVTTISVLGTTATVLFGIIEFFKEPIIHLISNH